MADTLKQPDNQPVGQAGNGVEVAPVGPSIEAQQRPVGEFIHPSNPLPTPDKDLGQFVKPVPLAQVPTPASSVELPQAPTDIKQQIKVEENQVSGKSEESSSWWHKLRAFSLRKKEEKEKQPASA